MNGLLEKMKPIMARIKENAQDALIKYSDGKLAYHSGQHLTQSYLQSIGAVAHHLYIGSKRRLTAGDCFVWLDGRVDYVTWSTEDFYNTHLDFGHLLKVEVTTDKSLWQKRQIPGTSGHFEHKPFPRPTNDFIHRYLKDKPKEVMVDMEQFHKITGKVIENWECADLTALDLRPRVKPDNTATILPVEVTWDDIFEAYHSYVTERASMNETYKTLGGWLKANYSVPKLKIL